MSSCPLSRRSGRCSAQVRCDRLRQPVLHDVGDHHRRFRDARGHRHRRAVTRQCCPLIRADVVDDTVTSTLDDINADLDTDVLKELMVKVEVDTQGPDVVAKDWLASR